MITNYTKLSVRHCDFARPILAFVDFTVLIRWSNSFRGNKVLLVRFLEIREALSFPEPLFAYTMLEIS